ncbi:reverse transcriptase domain-containing protein [Tanacetum coccineum]
MFALIVSHTEPKNIKEAIADHAWIEAMQEELYQFERLKVWELVDRPICKNVINMKWLWKNKHDEENTIMAPKKRTTRASPATTTTTTTPVTNAQLKALINQGVADALAARDADRSRNGDASHNSGTGIGHDAAYDIPWKTLMKMMTDIYYPRNEIKKLEMEIWDLKVKGTDLTSYTQCFQELALLCGRMFPEESDKIEKYVGGLPDMIHGSVMTSKPKTMQDAIEIATELMDKKISTLAERQAKNKRKLDNNNQTQQKPPKKQGVAIAYTTGSGERKEYAGTLPLCNRCKFHDNGQCTVKCANCKRVGHLTQDCRSPAATNNQRNPTCYECGNQGHYRSDCPKIKNQKPWKPNWRYWSTWNGACLRRRRNKSIPQQHGG